MSKFDEDESYASVRQLADEEPIVNSITDVI
jgi:hypothetical protein